MLNNFLCLALMEIPKLVLTYCFRERPPSLGPFRGPQKILVLITRSVRRNPSSLITRPLIVIYVSMESNV